MRGLLRGISSEAAADDGHEDVVQAGARECHRPDTDALPVESLDVVRPTLDDVFVVKTGRSLEGDDAA